MNTRQEFEEEFEQENELAIISYFADNIYNCEHRPSPIDIKQFYITQALKTLPQLKIPLNQIILEDLIQDSVRDRVH